MIPVFAKATGHLLCNTHCRAALWGAALGWIAWELLRVEAHTEYQLAMALTVIGAGSISFTLHALHAQASSQRIARAVRARACVCMLGSGVALSMNALQWLIA